MAGRSNMYSLTQPCRSATQPFAAFGKSSRVGGYMATRLKLYTHQIATYYINSINSSIKPTSRRTDQNSNRATALLDNKRTRRCTFHTKQNWKQSSRLQLLYAENNQSRTSHDNDVIAWENHHFVYLSVHFRFTLGFTTEHQTLI